MTPPRPALIGIYSSAPNSGKTTLAALLTEHGYEVVSFAYTLKTMVRVLLNQLGHSATDAQRLVFSAKEELIPELGVNTRHLLQTLGTEWGRQCVHPQLWLLCWEAAVMKYHAAGVPVVCDDVRFFNEAQLVRRLGGEMWHLRRNIVTPPSEHASEGDLDSYPHFDRRVDNTGSIDDLRLLVDRIVTTAYHFKLSDPTAAA